MWLAESQAWFLRIFLSCSDKPSPCTQFLRLSSTSDGREEDDTYTGWIDHDTVVPIMLVTIVKTPYQLHKCTKLVQSTETYIVIATKHVLCTSYKDSWYANSSSPLSENPLVQIIAPTCIYKTHACLVTSGQIISY